MQFVDNITQQKKNWGVPLSGPTYYNQDGLNGSNDISLSSLRRKLFTQVENKNAAEKDQLEIK